MTLLVRLFVLAAATALAGCSGTRNFSGHWTVEPCVSYFAPVEGGKRYYVFKGDMPPAAEAFFEKQRVYTKSSGEFFQAAYFKVEGKLEPARMFDMDFQRLYVKRVLTMEPPRADYVARALGKKASGVPAQTKKRATR